MRRRCYGNIAAKKNRNGLTPDDASARARRFTFSFSPDINFCSLFSYVGVAAPYSGNARFGDIEYVISKKICERDTDEAARARSPTSRAFVYAEPFLKKHYKEKCVRCEYLSVSDYNIAYDGIWFTIILAQKYFSLAHDMIQQLR